MARQPERAVTRPGEPARIPAAGRICGDVAGPDGCARGVFSRGLCRPHYRRAAKGLPLGDGRRRGDRSGHGRYGHVDVADGRLLCHDCGRWYVALGVHIGMTHDGGVRAYRLTHGLTMSQSLVAPPLRARLAAAASRPESMERIAAARDPDVARAAVDPQVTGRGHWLRDR